MNNMFLLFLKYRNFIFEYKNVIRNVFLILSIMGALIADGDALKSGFLGAATVAAFINFGESITELKKNKSSNKSPNLYKE